MTTTKKAFAIIPVLFCTFCVFVAGAHAATYYVNKATGNDSNPGSLENPWETIYKANTTLTAGDTVYIRGGTYTVGSYEGSTDTRGIQPANSGTLGNPITYSAYPGETVNLVGLADENVFSIGIYLNARSHIKVTGGTAYNLKLSKMCINLMVGPRPGHSATGNRRSAWRERHRKQ